MTQAFPLIEVDGPPEERGRSYGSQAGERIAKGLKLYADVLRARGVDLDSFASQCLSRLVRFDARLAEEVRGIAIGAEQPISSIIALNARTELTAWDSSSDGDGCTSGVALPPRTEGGRLLHGQNWDWRPECVDTAIVLLIRDAEGPDVLTFCEAGQLARNGMNSAGLAITANGLQTAKENNLAGLPSPFARRRMLMQSNLAEAMGVLLNTPRSASHNLTLSQIDRAGRAEAFNFETTPKEIFWALPVDGLLTHANHFKHDAALHKITDVGLERHPESLYRDRRLHEHLQADGLAITIATFQRGLADDFGAPHAVCRHPAGRGDGSFSATVASIVMDVAAGEMWAAPAPYLGAAYSRYALA